MNAKCFVTVFFGVVLFACAFVADAATIHISDDSRNLYAVDTSTWVAVKIGQTSAVMTDIAFDSSGNLYGIGGSSSGLYSIDTQDANSTRIGTATIASANALTFSPNGDLYTADLGSTYSVSM